MQQARIDSPNQNHYTFEKVPYTMNSFVIKHDYATSKKQDVIIFNFIQP